jgi:hypothetical protein
MSLANVDVDVSRRSVRETNTLSVVIDATVTATTIFPRIRVVLPETTLQLHVARSGLISKVTELDDGAKAVNSSLVLRSDLTINHTNSETISRSASHRMVPFLFLLSIYTDSKRMSMAVKQL